MDIKTIIITILYIFKKLTGDMEDIKNTQIELVEVQTVANGNQYQIRQ